jgi:hypothetical protein
MGRVPTQKLELLKRLFTDKAMSPGQAATEVGVTYATAKRYYDQWADDIKESLESKLLPNLEASVRQTKKTRSVKVSRRRR